MNRFTGNGDIGVTYINGKEISKNDLLLDFYGDILEVINSINIFMHTNTALKSIRIKTELNKIMQVLDIIAKDLGKEKEDTHYRISEHKDLENIINEYDILLKGKVKNNLLSSKDGCFANSCFINALKLERSFYKLNIDALYSTYLNRLSTYFNVLTQFIDEESGF